MVITVLYFLDVIPYVFLSLVFQQWQPTGLRQCPMKNSKHSLKIAAALKHTKYKQTNTYAYKHNNFISFITKTCILGLIVIDRLPLGSRIMNVLVNTTVPWAVYKYRLLNAIFHIIPFINPRL